MKRIEALIKPLRLEEVIDALVEAGIGPMTVSESLGCSGAAMKQSNRRGVRPTAGFVERVRIEIVVPTEAVSHVVDVLLVAARVGRGGGGMVVVMPVEQMIDVRTGQVDDDTTLGHDPGLNG